MNALVSKLDRFHDKDYRDGYLYTRVRSGIAYQIQALRRKLGFSQSEMATHTGKTQSVISRLEDTEYGRVSIQTLLDIASSLDVALLVQFVSYPDFLARSADMSNRSLQVDTIQESLAQELREQSMESEQEPRLDMGYASALLEQEFSVPSYHHQSATSVHNKTITSSGIKDSSVDFWPSIASQSILSQSELRP